MTEESLPPPTPLPNHKKRKKAILITIVVFIFIGIGTFAYWFFYARFFQYTNDAYVDGNNVSIDRESRLLSENALRFNLASSLYKAQIRAIRSAIQDGKNG